MENTRKDYLVYETYKNILRYINEMKNISSFTTNPNKGSKFHNLRRYVKRAIMASCGSKFAELIDANTENPYCFEIIKCEHNNANVLFTVRVASDNKHHNHKRGEFFHERQITMGMLKGLFKDSVNGYIAERKRQLSIRISDAERDLAALKFQLTQVESELI